MLAVWCIHAVLNLAKFNISISYHRFVWSGDPIRADLYSSKSWHWNPPNPQRSHTQFAPNMAQPSRLCHGGSLWVSAAALPSQPHLSESYGNMPSDSKLFLRVFLLYSDVLFLGGVSLDLYLWESWMSAMTSFIYFRACAMTPRASHMLCAT